MIYAQSSRTAFSAFSALLACVVGCSDESGRRSAQASQSLTVPLPTINQYVVMASRTATVGDRNNVSGGDVGIAPSPNATPNTLSIGMDSRVGVGEVLLSQRIVLRERSVTGELGANVVEATLATTGPRSPYLEPPAQPVPTGTFTAGTTAVTVNTGQTTNLAPGSFAAVNVSGILNLNGGTYTFQSLRLNPDARLIALAASTVRVTTGIAAADRSRLQAPTPQPAGNLRLIVNGVLDVQSSLSLGTDVQLRALVVARNAFRTGDRLQGSGAIAAQDVILGNDAQLAFNTGFSCTSNAECNDNSACTTDSCVNTVCVNAPVANGTACSDGNACTQTDSCQAGICQPGAPVVCTASDQCHAVGVCNPANGTCSNPNRPNGTACNDTNACTQTDTCQAGVCAGGSPVVCTASDQCHAAGVCNPANGTCSNPNQPNGAACTDGNACTQADTCQAGACQAGPPVVCTASNDCHDAGVCDAATGTCSDPPKPNGSACNDGSACTQTDTCASGECVGEGEVLCTASDQCHGVGSCDPATGTCSNPNRPDGTSCDDANACTIGDSCQAGACTAGGDYAVTEFDTGLDEPSWLIDGPNERLWFISSETTPEGFDGSVANITTAGVVSAQSVFPRAPYVLVYGADGMLWTAERFLGGLPAMGRYDAASGAYTADYFPGLLVNDMAPSNDGGMPLLWLTAGFSVVSMDPTGTIRSTTPTLGVARAITASRTAPTTLWFTEAPNGGVGHIGRLRIPALSQFTVPTSGELVDLVEGPDGGIWFTDTGGNRVARLSPDGATLDGYALPTAAAFPHGIANGPDGNLWFTMRDANKIGFITTGGAITEICIPTAASGPTSIVAGPDGNVWFTETASGKIGRVSLPILASEAEEAASVAPETEAEGCNVTSRRPPSAAMLGWLLGLAMLASARRRAAIRTRSS